MVLISRYGWDKDEVAQALNAVAPSRKRRSVALHPKHSMLVVPLRRSYLKRWVVDLRAERSDELDKVLASALQELLGLITPITELVAVFSQRTHDTGEWPLQAVIEHSVCHEPAAQARESDTAIQLRQERAQVRAV